MAAALNSERKIETQNNERSDRKKRKKYSIKTSERTESKREKKE